MQIESLASIDQVYLIVAALLVGITSGAAFERLLLSKLRRRAWRAKNAARWEERRKRFSEAKQPVATKYTDAADQLRIVMGANFTVQPLLNKSEARVFRELDRFVIDRNPAWQVMAQVSLGEILRSRDAVAYSCINSKRVDLLLVDGECQPRYAVEYQGGAHHQGTAAARDAVKKEALRRAGIGYYEVVAGQTTPTELRRLVEKLISTPARPE
jgi:uncharacterized membrane-anchored protein YhcB (DUF1043 family)